MDFSEIERRRAALGVNPTRMCAIAEVGGYNYWRARAGRVKPRAKTLAKWAAALSALECAQQLEVAE